MPRRSSDSTRTLPSVTKSRVTEFWRQIAWCGRQRPVDDLRKAEAMRVELTPSLLATLIAVLHDWRPFVEDGEFQGAGLSLLLLAKYREKRAYSLALDFLRFDPGTLYCLTDRLGDYSLHSVLASTFDGDADGLMAFAEQEGLRGASRAVCLRTLATLAAVGTITTAQLSGYLTRAVSTIRLTKSDVWNEFVTTAVEFHLVEHRDRAVGMCQARLLDPQRFSVPSIEAAFSCAPRTPNDYIYKLIDDVVDETDGWECFEKGA